MKKKIALVCSSTYALKMYSIVLHSLETVSLAHAFLSVDQLRELKLAQLGIVVMDCEAEGFSCEVVRNLKFEAPHLKILITYQTMSRELIYELLKCGIDGIVEGGRYETITVAINKALTGGAYLSPDVARMIVSDHWINRDTVISHREREVLECMAKGKSHVEISTILEISPETAKSHIRNIYQKLRVNKRDKAIRKAKEERIIL